MNNSEYVQVSIPKELYERVEKFGDIEEVILQDLTEWVEIMEDEERLYQKELKVRFYVYTYFNNFSPYVLVEAISRKDRGNDFVGKIEVASKEALLRIAKNGYGVLPQEIEFVN